MSRILICRTDNIGDVVLTLPLAGYLKQTIPGAAVDMLVRRYAAPAVQCSRFVDRALAVEDQDIDQLFAGGGYDTVIFAFPNRSLARAARRAKVPRRVGTSHRLHHWINCNRLAHFSRVDSDLHEAQLNFALLKPLGIDHIPPLAELPPLYGLTAPQSDKTKLLANGRFNLILHTKSNGNGREWPLARYTRLAERLQQHADVAIWLTGSGAEGELLQREAPELLAMPNVGNLCGRLDLGELIAVLAKADGVIASGTGPLHLAAALGQRTLGLFPPLKPIDPVRWGALGRRAQSMTGRPACAGCSVPAECACMMAIGVDQVEQVVLAWRAQKEAAA